MHQFTCPEIDCDLSIKSTDYWEIWNLADMHRISLHLSEYQFAHRDKYIENNINYIENNIDICE